MRQLCQYTLIVFYQNLTIKRLEDINVVHGKYYIIFMVITVLMIFVFCFVSVHWWVNQSIRWWLRKRITQSHLNMNENGAMFNMSQIEHLYVGVYKCLSAYEFYPTMTQGECSWPPETQIIVIITLLCVLLLFTERLCLNVFFFLPNQISL